jgi:hypothetical protein
MAFRNFLRRNRGTPESIKGDWSLADAADFAHCTGPFMAELKP